MPWENLEVLPIEGLDIEDEVLPSASILRYELISSNRVSGSEP